MRLLFVEIPGRLKFDLPLSLAALGELGIPTEKGFYPDWFNFSFNAGIAMKGTIVSQNGQIRSIDVWALMPGDDGTWSSYRTETELARLDVQNRWLLGQSIRKRSSGEWDIFNEYNPRGGGSIITVRNNHAPGPARL